MTPIFDNRNLIGYAKTEKQAARLVRSMLQTIPAGFIVDVSQRNTEVTGLPSGFVYCVRPK